MDLKSALITLFSFAVLLGPIEPLQALAQETGRISPSSAPPIQHGDSFEVGPHFSLGPLEDELGWGRLSRWAQDISAESAELWREEIEEDLCVFRQSPSQEGYQVLELDFMGTEINIPTAFEPPGFYPQQNYQIQQSFSSGQRVWELSYALQPEQPVRLKALAPVDNERVAWEPALAAALCQARPYGSGGTTGTNEQPGSGGLSEAEGSSAESGVHSLAWSLNPEGAQLQLSLGANHLRLSWQALCEPPAKGSAAEIRVLELGCQLQTP